MTGSERIGKGKIDAEAIWYNIFYADRRFKVRM